MRGLPDISTHMAGSGTRASVTHPSTNQAQVCLTITYFIMVAHGHVVTNSRQITEVKQRRPQLVLGWVTDAGVTLPAMCRGVGQAFHIMPPLSTQQRWVPGGTNNGKF